VPVDPSVPQGRCGVLGSPVAHSLSPVLHRAAYRELGLDWAYDAYEVASGELADFMGLLSPQWRGLSLTMPLKREVIELCDEVTAQGRLLSSVNTVVIEQDGLRRGYNTDVTGFVRAFQEAGVCGLDSAVVVGGGATAASAVAAVAALGAASVTVLARSTSRASILSGLGSELGLEVTVYAMTEIPDRRVDAVISTIPAEGHMAGAAAAVASLAPVLFDVVYSPGRTILTDAARAAGSQVIGGFALLLHQAARQVELMTGVDEAPLAAMRTAGAAALGNR
jgi:shikimate dehydrogenase